MMRPVDAIYITRTGEDYSVVVIDGDRAESSGALDNRGALVAALHGLGYAWIDSPPYFAGMTDGYEAGYKRGCEDAKS